jgi:yecA family protein
VTKPAYSYDELDEIFRGKGDNDIVGMSLIDGLIAALVAGPVFVDPREWLPLIFAGRLPALDDGTPEYLAVNTIFNRYNEVSATLADHPSAYRPILMHDAGRIIADHWAVGFMRGISLRVQQWTDVLLTDLRLTLAPIFVSHDMGAGFLPDIPKAEQLRRRPTAHQQIAEAVVALRQACNSKHSASFKPTKTRRVRPRRSPRQ